MIRRSALGKSSECKKYFCGRSSPKNTTSGFTVPAQKEHVGTLPLIMATCETPGKPLLEHLAVDYWRVFVSSVLVS